MRSTADEYLGCCTSAMQNQSQPTKLLYYEDAYLREFKATVLFVQGDGGQHKIVLDQTAFYPTGGGQPSDVGTIIGSSGHIQVKEVRTENKQVVHVVNETERHIEQGELVIGRIDWDRRYSLMRNHTLAHLMAEAARKATGLSLEVVGSGLDVDKARLDFAHEGSLGPLLPEIQRATNDIIHENRQVQIQTMPREEAEELVARFHESLKTLPPQVVNVRIIEIKDWHVCACGGTHVRGTAEIRGAEILHRMSKGKGVERIEFRAKTS
jgi:Ser-tRNA(Ala) deacylase AlaX